MDQSGGARGAKDTDRKLISIDPANKLRNTKDARFMCDVHFKNELPEISCDPKMLLPPLDAAALGAFRLTSLEREMKRDVLLPPDLGIPLNALHVQRYSLPPGAPLPLHPADAALVEGGGEGEAAAAAAAAGAPGAKAKQARGRGPQVAPSAPGQAHGRREGASDVAWLMRTKYITTEAGAAARAGRAGGAKGAGRAPEPEEAENDPVTRIAAIEASFEAARRPPRHPKNPEAVPLSELPVLPDELLEGWALVQASFDGDPAADAEPLARVAPGEARIRAAAAAQLKSFVRRRADGGQDKFVVYMVPDAPPAACPPEASAGGAIAAPPAAIAGDYRWVRVYDSKVHYDDRGQTYLLRIGADHVGYSDLNTKVALRKRKRGAAGDGDEDEPFAQPEKFVLRVLGEEGEEGGAAAAEESPAAVPAAPRTAEAMEVDGGEGEEGAAMTAAAMRDVFGSDDDE